MRVVGTLKHDGGVFDHGESVTASDVGGKENFEALKEIRTVVSEDEFKRLFPESEGEVIQASGTPSNSGDDEEASAKAEAPKAEEPKKATAPAPKSSDSKATEKKSDGNKSDGNK